MKKRIAVLAAAVVAFSLVIAAPLAAQDGADDGGTDDYGPQTLISCDDTTPTAGDTVTCEVSGCDANALLVATIDGTQVGTATTDATGAASIDIDVPAGIEGDATLLIDGCGEVVAAVLSVAAAPDLAFTGSESLPTALIAVALIAFGAVLALGARRYQLAAVRRED